MVVCGRKYGVEERRNGRARERIPRCSTPRRFKPRRATHGRLQSTSEQAESFYVEPEDRSHLWHQTGECSRKDTLVLIFSTQGNGRIPNNYKHNANAPSPCNALEHRPNHLCNIDSCDVQAPLRQRKGKANEEIDAERGSRVRGPSLVCICRCRTPSARDDGWPTRHRIGWPRIVFGQKFDMGQSIVRNTSRHPMSRSTGAAIQPRCETWIGAVPAARPECQSRAAERVSRMSLAFSALKVSFGLTRPAELGCCRAGLAGQ